jgi:hypothetical protein
VIGIVEHLERQLASTRRLLQVVLAQTDAIRAQDVEGVLARLADVQAEMVKRVQLERERDVIMQHAGTLLGCVPEAVTLPALLELLPGGDARRAAEMSAELRGLLGELSRVHAQNRLLIRQELSFLDHLMRVLSGTPQCGYTPVGQSTPHRPASVFDMRV